MCNTIILDIVVIFSMASIRTNDDLFELEQLIFKELKLSGTEYVNMTIYLNQNYTTGAIIPIYIKLREFIREYCTDLYAKITTIQGEKMLYMLSEYWIKYNKASQIIDLVYSHINQSYTQPKTENGTQSTVVTKVKNYVPIYVMCMDIWRTRIFNGQNMYITKSICNIINTERDGNVINTPLISGIIQCFIAIGNTTDKYNDYTGSLAIYKEYFESYIITATDEYYTIESQKFIESNKFTDYMKYVTLKLVDEETRISRYLHDSSTKSIINTCQQVFITRRISTYLEEFYLLLDNQALDDVNMLYTLVKRNGDGFVQLTEMFEKYVIKHGTAEICKLVDSTPEKTDAKMLEAVTKAPTLMVDAIMAIYNKFNDIVINTFANDIAFVSAFNRGCRTFINDNLIYRTSRASSKISELLSKYTDITLKKGTKDINVEHAIENAITIFKFTDEKDVFQKFYSKYLAKRLVTNNSVNDEYEANMIGKLKEQCGYEYTCRLQRMFNDIELSKTFTTKFTSSIKLKTDITINILTNGAWPFQKSLDITLPKELGDCNDKLVSFYNGVHSGRKLTFLHNLCRGELKTHYTVKSSKESKEKKPIKQQYTFVASAIQMAILLQFNIDDNYQYGMSVDDFERSTGIDPTIIVQVLDNLIKMKILTMVSDAKYNVNPKYSYKKLKVNIDVQIATEVKKEVDATLIDIEEDRKLEIQASIVRIMKARNVLMHTELMTEVISQMSKRFIPVPAIIKKCIGLLIEKEYMRRVEGERDKYAYIA